MSKELIGIVTSDSMNETVVVRVMKKYRHNRYGKVIIRHKKYKAHNKNNEVKKGDVVTICEVRPLSKEKTFIVKGKFSGTV